MTIPPDALSVLENIEANISGEAHQSATTGRRKVIDVLQGIEAHLADGIPDSGELDVNYVNVAGDTMEGALVLHADPTAPLHAAPKQYVDNAVASINIPDPPEGLTEEDVQNIVNTAIANIVNPEVPTGVVINVDVGAGNAVVSPENFLTADTLRVINATVQGRTVTLPATAGTVAIVSARTNTRNVDIRRGTAGYRLAPGGFVIVYLDGTANFMRVIAASASVNLTDYVAKGGDTMNGALQLSGAPTAPLHAATKAYADSIVGAAVAGRVSDAGDTMTGYLYLHADPVEPMQAVTKQYADSLVGAGGGASVHIGLAPPIDPSEGDLWWQEELGQGFIYYVDVNSSQWVPFNVSSPPAAIDITDSTVAGRAMLTAESAAAQRSLLDFVEASQDVVGAMVVAAGGSYNDGTGAITFPASSSQITVVQRSTTQSIPNGTTTVMSFNTELSDDANAWDVGTPDAIVVPSGVTRVRLTGGGRWASNSSNTRIVTLTINGVDWAMSTAGAWGAESDPAFNMVTPWVAVTAGQLLRLNVWQNSGGNLNVAANAWLQAEFR